MPSKAEPTGTSSLAGLEAAILTLSVSHSVRPLWALKEQFLGYDDLQEVFEELWNIWLGVGRGVRDSSANWSGACKGPAGSQKILTFLDHALRTLVPVRA
jgi:hypothetical protein